MMERIDSHQHFWKYDPGRQPWMTGEMGMLKRDYDPVELAPLLKDCQLQGSVAIQASQSEDENEILLALADSNPFIKGVVGWVDLLSISVAERLAYYHSRHRIKGFRHVLHDEADPDFMLSRTFLNGISHLRRFGYTYDLLIFPSHLANTLQLVRRFPDQPFVIDHLAKPGIRAGEISEWRKELRPLASLPNVYCKISGMVTEAAWRKWKQEDFTPYLDTIVEFFGANRIMYGSDWPVCTLSASYAETYGIINAFFKPFSKEEQERVFGLNAKQFYGL